MDRTGQHLLGEVSQTKKPKAACFLSYVDYRLNTNISILWKTGHAKGGHTWEGEVKEGN
jgi:hypothetical protein